MSIKIPLPQYRSSGEIEVFTVQTDPTAHGPHHLIDYTLKNCIGFTIFSAPGGRVIAEEKYDAPVNISAFIRNRLKLGSRYHIICSGPGGRTHAVASLHPILRSAPEGSLKFDYVFSPSEVYTSKDFITPSVATITIGVHNKEEASLDCSEIRLTIKSGSDAQDLTDNPATIVPLSLQDQKWSFRKFSPEVFVAEPIPPLTGLGPNETVTFQLTEVEINEKEGATPLLIEEFYVEDDARGSHALLKIKSSLEIVDFYAYPSMIKEGEKTTLFWQTKNASTVTVYPDVPKDQPTTGSYEVQPKKTTNYYCSAIGTGPRAIKTFPVTVEESDISIVEFKAEPTTVVLGGKTMITWEVQNVEDCSLEYDGQVLSLPASGQKEIALDKDTSFRLYAVKNSQLVEDAMSVLIYRPVINSFRADYSKGDGEVFWDTSYCTKVVLESTVMKGGEVQAKGSAKFHVPEITWINFKLIGYGYDGPVIQEFSL